MSSQTVTKLALLGRHARPWLVVMHRELLDDLACTSLGNATRLPDGIFKQAAKLAGESQHADPRQLTSTGPSIKPSSSFDFWRPNQASISCSERRVLRSSVTVCTFGSSSLAARSMACCTLP